MSNVKCLILAGGRGTRLPLWPYNKHLALVYDRPQLDHVLALAEDLGIRHDETAITYSQPYGRQIVAAYGHEYQTINQGPPNGIAKALYRAKDWVGEEPVVVLLGDQFFGDSRPLRQDLGVFLDSQSYPNPVSAGLTLVQHEQAYRHNRVSLEPLTFEEKPNDTKPGLVAVGCYFFTTSVFSAIEAQMPDARGEYNFSDTLRLLQERGERISTVVYDKFWCDNGTPENILKSAMFLGGRS